MHRPSGFELVLTSGTTLACTALENETTSSDLTDYRGDGTTGIAISAQGTAGGTAMTATLHRMIDRVQRISET